MKKNQVIVKTNLLALDIGSHSVKVAAGQRNGDRLKVTALGKRELPAGVYESGQIVDALALKTTIASLIKDLKIKVKDVVVCYESQDIIKREMTVQKVDADDQLELITYEVSQYLPIDIDAYVLQYKVLEEIEEDGSPKLKIILGAMPKETVKGLFDLMNDCGLNPSYFDMHSNALEKFMEYNFGSIKKTKTIAFVDYGHQMIDITLFEKGEFKFNRLIKLGAREFDKVLMDHLNLPAEEAETRKKKTSVLALQNAETEKVRTSDDVKDIVVRETNAYISEVADEIDKVFKYYTTRGYENKIDEIYLIGGGAQFKEIVPFFKNRFELETYVVDRFEGIDLATKTAVEDLPIYVHAVGALIRK